MPNFEVMFDLASSLAVGLLIGTERGWSARETDDPHLVAGIRTFGLTGLLGGIAALIAQHLGQAAWIAILFALGLLVLAGYIGDLLKSDDRGMTSEIAMLLTFLLGSLALYEGPELAAAGAVVVALLLSLKGALHAALRKLTAKELSGALKLLFISLVLLPVLPNRGYGPWHAFNPYETWWMVVLIAGIGFAAYVSIRLLGTRAGLLLTALLGGMVSSTAMTLTLSRMHDGQRLQRLLASGLLATSGMMFPRILLEVGVVNPTLLPRLMLPMAAATLVYAAGAFLYYRHTTQETLQNTEPPLKNPFELGPALRFGALLLLILLMVNAAQHWLGDTGIYLVALVAGLSDVDAITLSLAGNALGELNGQVAVEGIFLAALSNSLVKGGLVFMVGGRQLAGLTLPFMAAGLLTGMAMLWLP